MSENQLISLSKAFAVDIVSLCAPLAEKRSIYPLVKQLLRSGTSIGANIHESNYASSRADFINKLQIAQKESHETAYWLELLKTTKYIDDVIYNQLFNANSKIMKLLTASIKTAKANSPD